MNTSSFLKFWRTYVLFFLDTLIHVHKAFQNIHDDQLGKLNCYALMVINAREKHYQHSNCIIRWDLVLNVPV